MRELQVKVDELIQSLNNYKTLILMCQTEKVEMYFEEIATILTDVVPKVIESYDRKELENVREDKEYWLSQLDRIVDALNSDDDLFKIDVLFYETAENMKLYLNMIKEL